MSIVALVCASLLALGDDLPPPAAVAAEYQHARAAAGRGPDEQVRLALWCEAHGLTAERARHLALAVLADPGHATARGLAGFVARDGRWLAADAVAAQHRADEASAALRAEYDRRRSQAPYTADAQWALGVWADERGLEPQARAHFVAVTRLDPGREVAWKRLGFRKHDGRWATHEQVVAARAEAEAQARADRAWRPKLERWREQLARPDRREAARAALLDVTDPRALPSIARVFGTDRPDDQGVAVGLLGQIESPAASRGLAALGLQGGTPEVRRVAADTLARRDPRDFVDGLVALVRRPWRAEVRPAAEPGRPAELFVEGERFNVRRLYETAAGRAAGANAPAGLVAGNLADLLAGPGGGQATRNDLSTTNRALVDAMVAAVGRAVPAGTAPAVDEGRARRTIAEDIQAVQAANRAIQAVNDRVVPILVKVTGRDLGEGRDAWARWDDGPDAYAYRAGAEKPTYSSVSQLVDERPTFASVSRMYDCFVAGTLVRTIDGARAIEQVVRGDLVLAQDAASGALSYQPVLTAFRHPPSATYRVRVGGEDLVATGIHRFWRVGKGWIMARDLRAGDSVRVLGGVATVAAVEPGLVRPVFNIEVAEGQTFFVGRLGALVHDNTAVEATPDPFDAPPALAVAR